MARAVQLILIVPGPFKNIDTDSGNITTLDAGFHRRYAARVCFDDSLEGFPGVFT
jgi:hypothetical protein